MALASGTTDGFGSDRQGEALEALCADTLRVLAMDAVEAAASGHPGMPMGMADVAHLLWTEHLTLDPRDPRWLGRDRFVLSAGHGSMLLYGLLHLSGFDLPLDELKRFRQLGSRTPGHPENFLTAGVETTTGPLGQGFSNAVGMALAERHLVSRFPEAREVLEQRTFVIASDGDLMEGVASEAASLAGHLGLARLVVLYDDNGISIDGPTTLAFTEDVPARFRAYGWRTARVDGHDRAAVRAALRDALAHEADGQPALIACRTVIGRGAPTKQNTAEAHGAPLGKDELARTKEAMGWPQEPFLVPQVVRARWERRRAEWAAARARWDAAWARIEREHPATARALTAWTSGDPPALDAVAWPTFAPGTKLATRAASGKVLAALSPAVPNLLGGSADLTPSNNTYVTGQPEHQRGAYQGRNLRFGVREHAMGSVMNGIALHGALIPYGGTFLVFTDYARPAIRLSALMGTRVVYVMTHDSVFLGEDGPTHQPIEHLAALRAIPDLRVIRPADARETALAWRMALEHRGPSVLALTRQALPVPEGVASPDGALRGGYVLWESAPTPALVLVATGSEVHVALEVGRTLAKDDGLAVRVVSLPCWEVFQTQGPAYREQVIPPTCGARVSLEAASTFGWERHVGELGLSIGIDTFGESAPAGALAEHFGLTPRKVLARVREYLKVALG